MDKMEELKYGVELFLLAFFINFLIFKDHHFGIKNVFLEKDLCHLSLDL